MRWIPDARKSFLNRLQWSVKEPGDVNHEPVAVLNGDRSNEIIFLHAKPGERIKLDASESYDPDGDELHFHWFRYAEADSYPGEFELPEPGNPHQWVDVPADFSKGEIHLVLEVRDGGSPDLVRYRRVVVKGG